jgi:hypothetical protein
MHARFGFRAPRGFLLGWLARQKVQNQKVVCDFALTKVTSLNVIDDNEKLKSERYHWYSSTWNNIRLF